VIAVQCEEGDGQGAGMDCGSGTFEMSCVRQRPGAQCMEQFDHRILPASSSVTETFSQSTHGKAVYHVLCGEQIIFSGVLSNDYQTSPCLIF